MCTTWVQQHGCLRGERRHPWEHTKHSERLARQHRRSQDEPTMAAFESDHLEQVHVFILLLCLLQWKYIMRWALLAKFVVFRDQERSSAMCTPRNVLSTCLTWGANCVSSLFSFRGRQITTLWLWRLDETQQASMFLQCKPIRLSIRRSEQLHTM